VEALRSDNF